MYATEHTTRKKLSLLELAQRFSSEDKARRWFERLIWPDGERACPNCGSLDTHEASHPKMPYRCRDCRKYFSVKTGTVMAGSPLSLRKWAFAIYLDATSVKGIRERAGGLPQHPGTRHHGPCRAIANTTQGSCAKSPPIRPDPAAGATRAPSGP